MCKECGSSGFCEHGLQRSRCKKCGGKGICEHGRQRYDCKECGGKRYCEHGRMRKGCKECGGKGICEHGRQRYGCKECTAAKKSAADTGADTAALSTERRVSQEEEAVAVLSPGTLVKLASEMETDTLDAFEIADACCRGDLFDLL